MVIAGIDLDSNSVHIVRLNLDDNTAAYNRIRVNNVKGDYHERARRLRDLMPARGAWKDHGVIRFSIEEPMTAPGHGGFQSAVPQAVLRGALLACLPTGIPVELVKAHEWKRQSLGGGSPGHGNAKKPEIREWAEAHWANPPDHFTQDAADAFCIAWAARATHYPDERRRAA